MKMRILCALAATLATTGCFDLTQEVWIEPDGSGRVRLDIGLGREMLGMLSGAGEESPLGVETRQAELDRRVAADANLTAATVSTRDEGGQMHLVLDLEVADLTQIGAEWLNGLMESEGDAGEQGQVEMESNLAEELRIERAAQGFRFHQVLDAGGQAAPEEPEDPMAAEMQAAMMEMMAGMFADHAYTVRVHGPGFASHNGILSADGRTVEWRFALADLMTGELGASSLDALVTPGGPGPADAAAPGRPVPAEKGAQPIPEEGDETSLVVALVVAGGILLAGAGMLLMAVRIG